jgi:DNA-binding MarR family transcriptional regulator
VSRADVAAVLELYPKIFFACHTRHVRDPKTKRLLSAHQASILDHLDEDEPTNLRRLAAHMGVTSSTMSLAVTRLVTLGYVRRARDRSDKRVVGLRLTAAGLRVRLAQSVLEPERVARMFGQLEEGERRDAIRGLALLAQASEQAMREFSREQQGRRQHLRHVTAEKRQ